MEEPASVLAYRQLIADSVDEFVNASRGFGEPVTAMAYMVKRAFELQLEFIVRGVRIAQPDEISFSDATESLSGAIHEIQEFRNRNRHIDEFFNHLSTISESIVALSWISVRGTPAQFVHDMRDAGDYFGNRVLSTNKGNKRHANWITKWNDVLKQLEQYVREFHLTGFNWNSARDATIPPRAPPLPPNLRPDPMAGGDDRSALLNQLNQGIGITRMLRPVVRRDQATGASPPLDVEHQAANASQPQAAAAPAPAPAPAPASPPVPAPPPASPARTSQAAAMRVFPPKFFLDGRKWRVEHQKDNYSLVIENDSMSESLAMFKCTNAGLEVKNKMNVVNLDNCKQTTVVLNDIISSVEIIRCERLKVQCSGHVPLISLDSSDSVQIFLTDKSQDVEIIQSKSTSCNVCILKLDGDYVELPLPEQIKTVVVDRKLQSSAVEKK